jgi:hypothetical protein
MSDQSSSAAGSCKINWRKIAEFEGNAASGYVPMDRSGNIIGESGVTIGMGIDLGAFDETALDALGLQLSLNEKLRPYLGLKRTAAIDKLEKAPLRLTLEEVDTLNAAIQAAQVAPLQRAYDAAVGPDGPRFDNLPEPARTVIASVKFQWGNIWHRVDNANIVSFWRAAVAQDWRQMETVLRGWTPATYHTRRNAEADCLRPLLSADA